MIDPSLNGIFQWLGYDDEDVFDAQLKTWVPPPKPGGQSLTLLITLPGYTAAKTFEMRAGKIEPVEYDAGWEFKVAEINVNSIWDLFRALQTTAVSEVESFAVRGAISTAGRAALAKRGVIYRRGDDTWPAAERHLIDAPSHMFVADVDDWELPAEILPTDLAAQAEYVAARFAEIEPSFKDAALIAQASNSAGQSETEFSLKIWGWLLKPVTTEDLRNWTHAMNAALGPTAGGKAALDFHQAVTVQPIYHHTPRFTGMADPMRGQRWRYLHRAGGMIKLKLAHAAAGFGFTPASARLQVIAGEDGWKARLRAELGMSGCYSAIKTAAYAAVEAGASDDEIVAEIRAAAGDGRKFPLWSAAYVKKKTSPHFLRPMIANARVKEADRPSRIAASVAGVRTHLGLAPAARQTR
jgi:hypothetical protein